MISSIIKNSQNGTKEVIGGTIVGKGDPEDIRSSTIPISMIFGTFAQNVG